MKNKNLPSAEPCRKKAGDKNLPSAEPCRKKASDKNPASQEPCRKKAGDKVVFVKANLPGQRAEKRNAAEKAKNKRRKEK